MSVKVRELAESVRDYTIAMRREFHMYPELSFQEFETCKRIKRELNAMGLAEGQDYVNFDGTNGILVTMKGGKPGQTLLMRADMDALVGQEDSSVDFQSKNDGVVHSCGHDGHMAMMLGAIKVLFPMRDQLAGTVKCLFQPSEENGLGAKQMIENGVMDGVDAVFSIHLWSGIPVGRISAQAGPRMAGAEFFRLTMKGKSAHGATPHMGHDAALAAGALILNLQQIVSRCTDPLKSAVVTVGHMGAGVQRNTIAEEAFLEGTTRIFAAELMDWENPNCFKNQIAKITKATAEVYGVESNVEKYWLAAYPVINAQGCSAVAIKAIEETLGPEGHMSFDALAVGEDLSFYFMQAPQGGCLALVGVGNPTIDADWPQHSVHFKMDEEGIFNGLMLNIQYALDWSAAHAE